jgi:Fe-S-cluster containining protein
MNCPFCNNQVQHLALHIKEEHPKKFNFLKSNKPELYKRLQKELNLHEMVKSKDPNLFVLKVENEMQYFRYNCIRCGKCCHEYEIEIIKDDVEQWIADNREELLAFIQIYPPSMAIMNLGFIEELLGLSISEIDLSKINLIRSLDSIKKFNVKGFMEEIMKKYEELSQDTLSKVKIVLETQSQLIGYFYTDEVKELDEQIETKLFQIRDFILSSHNYLGEPLVDRRGNPIKDPLMTRLKLEMPQIFDENYGVTKGKFPHWFLGIKYSPRSILSPKSFRAIKEGWNCRLKYYLIYELQGGCGFQKNNLCSIHEYKPTACKEFPYTRKKLSPKADSIFLQSCKGLKRIL